MERLTYEEFEFFKNEGLIDFAARPAKGHSMAQLDEIINASDEMIQCQTYRHGPEGLMLKDGPIYKARYVSKPFRILDNWYVFANKSKRTIPKMYSLG